METNTMNELGLAVKVTESMINQLHSWPASVAIVFLLVVAGSAIRTHRVISNRWAVFAIFGLGMLLNVFVGDPGKVHPGQRNPTVMLAIYGFGLGFIALCIYSRIGKWMDRRLRAFDENQTQIIDRNQINETNEHKSDGNEE